MVSGKCPLHPFYKDAVFVQFFPVAAKPVSARLGIIDACIHPGNQPVQNVLMFFQICISLCLKPRIPLIMGSSRMLSVEHTVPVTGPHAGSLPEPDFRLLLRRHHIAPFGSVIPVQQHRLFPRINGLQETHAGCRICQVVILPVRLGASVQKCRAHQEVEHILRIV